MKFHRFQSQYAGRILIKNYSGKSLTISPLAENVNSDLKCECGHAVWNAKNFGNLVHFCPNQEYEFFVSDFKAVKI